MDYISNVVDVRIDVFKRDDPETKIASFIGNTTNNKRVWGKKVEGDIAQYTSNGLISYSFTKSKESPSSQFSFSVVPETDGNNSLIDIIEPRSLVKIYEYDFLVFMGVVESSRYSSRYNDGAPSRPIDVAGYSLGGIIEKLNLNLDPFIFNVAREEEDSKLEIAIAEEIEKGEPVRDAVVKIIDGFFGLLDGLSKKEKETTQNSVLTKLKDEYLGLKDENLCEDITFDFPISITTFKTENMSLWSVIIELFPPPFYEVFFRIENTKRDDGTYDGKLKLIVRESPFPLLNKDDTYDFSKWNNLNEKNQSLSDTLKKHKLDERLVKLVGYDLQISGEDMYSFYLVIPAGIEMSPNFYKAVNGINHCIDKKAVSIYGLKPLEIVLKFYNNDLQSSKDKDDFTELIQSLSRKLMGWFKNNDMAYSGTIDFLACKDGEVFEVGEKLEFFGGEFYIEKIDTSWSYGDHINKKLFVTRGLVYNKNKDGTISKIPNIARKIGFFLRTCVYWQA